MLSLVIMEEKFKKIRQYQLDNDLFLKFIKNNFKNTKPTANNSILYSFLYLYCISFFLI